jgi:bacteriorhodopsin
MVLAEIIVYTVGIYAGFGVLFALYFVVFGITKLDEAAKGTSFFFRFLIFFAAIAFWILLARRLFFGEQRPTEKNAHREKARETK